MNELTRLMAERDDRLEADAKLATNDTSTDIHLSAFADKTEQKSQNIKNKLYDMGLEPDVDSNDVWRLKGGDALEAYHDITPNYNVNKAKFGDIGSNEANNERSKVYKQYAYMHKMPLNDAIIEVDRQAEAYKIDPTLGKQIEKLRGQGYMKDQKATTFDMYNQSDKALAWAKQDALLHPETAYNKSGNFLIDEKGHFGRTMADNKEFTKRAIAAGFMIPSDNDKDSMDGKFASMLKAREDKKGSFATDIGTEIMNAGALTSYNISDKRVKHRSFEDRAINAIASGTSTLVSSGYGVLDAGSEFLAHVTNDKIGGDLGTAEDIAAYANEVTGYNSEPVEIATENISRAIKRFKIDGDKVEFVKSVGIAGIDVIPELATSSLAFVATLYTPGGLAKGLTTIGRGVRSAQKAEKARIATLIKDGGETISKAEQAAMVTKVGTEVTKDASKLNKIMHSIAGQTGFVAASSASTSADMDAYKKEFGEDMSPSRVIGSMSINMVMHNIDGFVDKSMIMKSGFGSKELQTLISKATDSKKMQLAKMLTAKGYGTVADIILKEVPTEIIQAGMENASQQYKVGGEKGVADILTSDSSVEDYITSAALTPGSVVGMKAAGIPKAALSKLVNGGKNQDQIDDGEDYEAEAESYSGGEKDQKRAEKINSHLSEYVAKTDDVVEGKSSAFDVEGAFTHLAKAKKQAYKIKDDTLRNDQLEVIHGLINEDASSVLSMLSDDVQKKTGMEFLDEINGMKDNKIFGSDSNSMPAEDKKEMANIMMYKIIKDNPKAFDDETVIANIKLMSDKLGLSESEVKQMVDDHKALSKMIPNQEIISGSEVNIKDKTKADNLKRTASFEQVEYEVYDHPALGFRSMLESYRMADSSESDADTEEAKNKAVSNMQRLRASQIEKYSRLNETVSKIENDILTQAREKFTTGNDLSKLTRLIASSDEIQSTDRFTESAYSDKSKKFRVYNYNVANALLYKLSDGKKGLISGAPRVASAIEDSISGMEEVMGNIGVSHAKFDASNSVKEVSAQERINVLLSQIQSIESEIKGLSKNDISELEDYKARINDIATEISYLQDNPDTKVMSRTVFKDEVKTETHNNNSIVATNEENNQVDESEFEDTQEEFEDTQGQTVTNTETKIVHEAPKGTIDVSEYGDTQSGTIVDDNNDFNEFEDTQDDDFTTDDDFVDYGDTQEDYLDMEDEFNQISEDIENGRAQELIDLKKVEIDTAAIDEAISRINSKLDSLIKFKQKKVLANKRLSSAINYNIRQRKLINARIKKYSDAINRLNGILNVVADRPKAAKKYAEALYNELGIKLDNTVGLATAVQKAKLFAENEKAIASEIKKDLQIEIDWDMEIRSDNNKILKRIRDMIAVQKDKTKGTRATKSVLENSRSNSSTIPDIVSATYKNGDRTKTDKRMININSIVEPDEKAKNIISSVGVDALNNDVINAEVDKVVANLSGILASAVTQAEQYKLLDDPARGLLFTMNEKGGVEVNRDVAAAIAYASSFYSATILTNTAINTNGDIAKLTGVKEEELSSETTTALRKVGSQRKLVASTLSDSILSVLSLKEKDTADREMFQKMKTGLGAFALLHMQSEGEIERLDSGAISLAQFQQIVEFSTDDINVDELDVEGLTEESDAADAGSSKNSKTAKIRFVKVKTDEDGKATTDVMKHKQIAATFEAFEVQHEKRGPVFNQIDASNRDYTKIRRNKVTTVPEKSMQMLATSEQNEWELDLESVEYVLSNKDLIMKNMGYVELKHVRTKSEKDSQEGKNKEIEMSMLSLEDTYAEIRLAIDAGYVDSGNTMYFKYFFSKNGRFFIDSGTFNPQTDKLHRYMANLQTGRSDVDTELKGEGAVEYKFGIAQAFGYAVDKKHTEKVIAFADAVLALDDNQISQIVSDAISGKKIKIGTFENEFVKEDLVIEVEELGHMISGMMAVKSRNQAIASGSGTFNTNLTVEFDAVTNGFILKMLQFPVLGAKKDNKGNIVKTSEEVTKEWLEKGGIIFNDSENYDIESFNDLIDPINGKSGIVDVYKTLAKSTTKIKYETIADSDANGIFKSLMDNFPDILVDGEVTKFGRELFKDPVMTFGYGAALKSIKRYLGIKIVEEYEKAMLSGKWENGDTVSEQEYQKIGFNGKQAFLNHMIKNTFSSIIIDTKEGKKKLTKHLQTLARETYGVQIENALSYNFSDMVKVNQTINNGFSAIFDVFNAEFERRIRKVELANRNPKDGKEVSYGVTAVQMKEILAELVEIMPIIKGPLSESIEDGILIISDEIVPGATATQTHLKDSSSVYKNDAGGVAKTFNTQVMIRRFKKAFSSGVVNPIHYTDAAIILRSIDDALGIHDAKLESAIKSKDGVVEYNKGVVEVSQEYSIIDELYSTMVNVYKNQIARNPDVKNEVAKKFTATAIEVKKLMQKTAIAKFKLLGDSKFSSSKSMKVMQMAATPGSEYVHKLDFAKDRKSPAISSMVKDFRTALFAKDDKRYIRLDQKLKNGREIISLAMKNIESMDKSDATQKAKDKHASAIILQTMLAIEEASTKCQ